MIQVNGRIISDAVIDCTNYRVAAHFRQILGIVDDVVELFDGRVETAVTSTGSFRLEIPGEEERQGDVRFVAIGPDGLEAGETILPVDGPFDDVEITVTVPDRTTVPPSTDLTLGAQIKYRGRAIDRGGRGLRPGLLVVIWAQREGAGDPVAVSVAKTIGGGYFSAPWPSERFAQAFAVVSGSEPVPIALEGNLIPQRFILVVESPPQAAPGSVPEDGDCRCAEAPPRAPDAVDVAANPEAFAQDAERCIDFTVPNRTVEELTYQAVVRTTQPELKATKPTPPPNVPPNLVDRLAQLARVRPSDVRSLPSPEVEARPAPGEPGTDVAFTTAEPSMIRLATTFGFAMEALERDDVLAAAVQRARRFAPGISLEGGWAAAPATRDEIARALLAEREQRDEPLVLERSVLAELAREPGELTPRRLIEAERTSVVRRFRNGVSLLASPSSGRFLLDDEHQIAWDEIPDAFQATTIAHGHLLTLKQVWRADGYSLGDLLYSLPLAPGQQKLISMLDWNRSEIATRRARRRTTEDVAAELSHDRDVSEVIRTSLRERMDASSHADTEAVGGGIGGFIGPFVFGAAGGVSSAGSTASQTSARSVTGFALNRVRDRTLQAASAVRSQRASVVQTARQGEAVRAQTEVVANYNHCHAVTVEYFEVLRHLQVTQELAHVQECLFIPFAITAFNTQKALRWRRPLQRHLRQRALSWAFDALERVHTNWEDADYPAGRYADETLRQLDGEFHVRVRLPRPADDDDDDFVAANWDAYTGWLWDTPVNIWTRYLGVALPQDRDRIWDERIAPGIAQRILERLTVTFVGTGPGSGGVTVDPTLVSPFRQDRSLLVGVRAAVPLPNWQRSHIQRLRIALDFTGLGNPPGSAVLPAGAEMLVESANMTYRTDHFTHHLFGNRRVLNDLTLGDTVEIATPLSIAEKRNPRDRDRRGAERLLDHLNEHVEHYHRAIWLSMDPNRRYLLLDGFIAPDAGGRSVASVVENRVVGIVGNSLVMPVAPGQRLDCTYEFADATPEDLRHLYSGDPAPPMRISLPTSGVFAEAVQGKCNSCEVIDDTRFWRWEEAPIPDQPTLIAPLTTDSLRRQPPSLAPDAFPEALVRLQQTPSAPDPTGLAAAVKALGVANVFKDITGLALNQENAAEALKASIKAGQDFAMKAGALAQQRFLNGELDRGLDHIKSARENKLISDDQAKQLTESLLRGAIGEQRPQSESPTKTDAVKRAMERVPGAKNGSLRVTRPEGTVEVNTGTGAGRAPLDVSVSPDVTPIQQPSTLTCWAAGGAMMASWRAGTPLAITTVLDGVGGEWRAKFDNNEGLTANELRAFLATLNLVEEGPQSYTPEGLARLLQSAGPLLEIGDDSVENNMVAHVRIITAIRGTGKAESTFVTLADSATGTLVTETFVEFDRRHGAEDPVRVGVGLFHF